jgi:hypothetical protein
MEKIEIISKKVEKSFDSAQDQGIQHREYPIPKAKKC